MSALSSAPHWARRHATTDRRGSVSVAQASAPARLFMVGPATSPASSVARILDHALPVSRIASASRRRYRPTTPDARESPSRCAAMFARHRRSRHASDRTHANDGSSRGAALRSRQIAQRDDRGSTVDGVHPAVHSQCAPQSYVPRRSGDLAWCAASSGSHQPISRNDHVVRVHPQTGTSRRHFHIVEVDQHLERVGSGCGTCGSFAPNHAVRSDVWGRR